MHVPEPDSAGAAASAASSIRCHLAGRCISLATGLQEQELLQLFNLQHHQQLLLPQSNACLPPYVDVAAAT